jgi:phosphoglycolate phosphatase-like HAD superfamily hydrolase
VETAVFLDFDGVICDSVLECLASSWAAYHQRLRDRAPMAVPIDLRERFASLRPFARAAEDFMLIQELLDAGKEPRSQAEFDRERAARRSRLGRYRRLMYAVRGEQLRADPGRWLALHRLYPHVLRGLPLWISKDGFHILSTKRPRFIRRILLHYGLAMDRRRILPCLRGGKQRTIARTMRRKGIRRALFVDDQLDHLRPESQSRDAAKPAVSMALASWGYLREEWLRDLPQGVELLHPAALASRVNPLLDG